MLHTQEFKDKIINEVEEVKSLSVVCKKHSLPVSTVATWIKTRNKKIEYNLETSKKDLKDENKNLKKKLLDTELELKIIKDLLKKTYQM